MSHWRRRDLRHSWRFFGPARPMREDFTLLQVWCPFPQRSTVAGHLPVEHTSATRFAASIPGRRKRLTVFGNGECLSCGKRYQLPAGSAGKTYTCQFCGGLLVASSQTGPIFQKRPAPPEMQAREHDTRAPRGKGRPIRLPARSWWPLLILWSAAGVMVLLLGGYAWRSYARPIDVLNETLLAATPASGDLSPLAERWRKQDRENR